VKRGAAIPLAVVVLAVVAAIVSATGLAGPGGGQDSVYGGGRHAGGGACTDGTTPFCPPNPREFSIDAHANRNGAGAQGTLEYANPDTGAIIASGDVTCLRVVGETAVVGGFLNEGPAAGTGWFLQVEDRGRPGSATRDRVSPVFLLVDVPDPPGFPRRCPAFEDELFGDVGFFSQTFGDVAVVDE